MAGRWLGRVALPIALAIAAGRTSPHAVGAPPQVTQTPMFRSTVDLVAVDVQVVGREGSPIDGLGIDDFEVAVNGHKRRLVSVDFVRKPAVLPPDQGGPDLPISTPGYIAPGTRVFILAIDTSTFAPGAIKPHLQAAQRFIGRLPPDDMAAVYVYPY